MRVPGFTLRDRITIERYLGAGAYGDTYGPEEKRVKAHVEPTNRLVIDPQGQTTRAEAVVILRPEAGPVPLESRLTWGDKTYRVLTAGALPDEVRPTHLELMIG